MLPALRGILPQVFAYLLWLVSAAACVVAVVEFRSAITIAVPLGVAALSLALREVAFAQY